MRELLDRNNHSFLFINFSISNRDFFSSFDQPANICGLANYRGNCYLIVAPLPLFNSGTILEKIIKDQIRRKSEIELDYWVCPAPFLGVLKQLGSAYMKANFRDSFRISELDHCLMAVLQCMSQSLYSAYGFGKYFHPSILSRTLLSHG